MFSQYNEAIAELPCRKAVRELLHLPHADDAKAVAKFSELLSAIDGQPRATSVRMSIPTRGVASGLLLSVLRHPRRTQGPVTVRRAAGA